MSWSPDAIVALRKELGFSQSELADRLDVTYRTVWQWERGRHPPSTYHAARLTLLAAGVS